MLVGREAELRQLNQLLQRAHEGHGNVVFIGGEAGRGKTTLVHTWMDQVRRRMERTAMSAPLFAEAVCSITIASDGESGSTEALQPFAMLMQSLGMQLARKTRETQGALDVIRRLAPKWIELIPVVGELTSALMETYEVFDERKKLKQEAEHGAVNQQQIFQQYSNFLMELSRREDCSGVVILLDDMHWADASSVNLLFHLSRQIASERILIIVTYRNDDAEAARGGEGHPIVMVKNEIMRYSAGIEMELETLDIDAVRAFLSNSFVGYLSDDAFENWLMSTSGGNALFMTQFVETLKDDGLFDGRGRFTGTFGEVTVPPSVNAVIAERIRRLDEETNELLRYASAEGEEFTSGILSQLADEKPLKLLAKLRKAEQMGIIARREAAKSATGKSNTVFAFSHALFHRTLYDSLLEEEREILHQSCFELLREEWTAVATTDRVDTTLASKLLVHAEKCGEFAEAAEYAMVLAREFWNRYAESEALEMIERTAALQLQAGHPDSTLRAESTALAATIDRHRGRFVRALQRDSEAIDLFTSSGNHERAADSMFNRAWVLYLQGEYEASLAEAERSLSTSESTGYRRGEAAALRAIANAKLRLGSFTDARGALERSLEITRANDDRAGEAAALGNLGNVRRMHGELTEAIEYYRQSLEIFEETGNRSSQAIALNNIGSVEQTLGHVERAREAYEKSLEIVQAIGDRAGEALVLYGIATAHDTLGEHEKALNSYERSLEIARSTGDRPGQARALKSIAEAHNRAGEYDRSLEHLERSLEIFQTMNQPHGQAASLLQMAAVLRRAGRLEESRGRCEESLRIARELEHRESEAGALGELGLIARAAGDAASAEELLRRCVEIYRTLEHRELERWEREMADLG